MLAGSLGLGAGLCRLGSGLAGAGLLGRLAILVGLLRCLQLVGLLRLCSCRCLGGLLSCLLSCLLGGLTCGLGGSQLRLQQVGRLHILLHLGRIDGLRVLPRLRQLGVGDLLLCLQRLLGQGLLRLRGLLCLHGVVGLQVLLGTSRLLRLRGLLRLHGVVGLRVLLRLRGLAGAQIGGLGQCCLL
ncbi:hypothetical protein DUPY_05120 [Duganella phyllosphaerae]|uniref:Uncharacterized protein n=1 Tax=Duganella phyllosphaerae TaxID=762836 RepID=A0A1E7X6M0_9BURK|nr:hypothetical protein DUPY_05120 [Duganella phyllosphaerae]